MPLLEHFDSDEGMGLDVSDTRWTVEQATPPPVRTFTSKADLMNCIMDDDIPDYDFMDDSEDSDLEIYGQAKGSPVPPRACSTAHTDDEGSFREDVNASSHVAAKEDVDMEDEIERDPIQPSARVNTEAASKSLASYLRFEDLEDDFGTEEQQKHNNQEGPSFVNEEPENEASIKPEDSDGWADDESIHHDGESCGAGSTIDDTPSIDPAPVSETATSELILLKTPATLRAPELIEAPQEVQTLLNEYWDVHGRKMPPPAVFIQLGKWFDQSKKATWLHISGEVLEASIYNVTGIASAYKSLDKRIMVVKGPTVRPSIIGYQSSGGRLKGVTNIGSRYQIWHGLKGETAEGFESHASVWKGYMHSQVAANLNSDQIKAIFERAATRPIPKSKQNGAVIQQPNVKAEFGKLNTLIPDVLKIKIEQWSARHGRKIPPCSSHSKHQSLLTSTSGAKSAWWHASGVEVVPQVYILDEDQAVDAAIIVVEGNGVGPFAVRYAGGGNTTEAISYRIWEGLGANGDQGFERRCSIFKIFTGRTPTMKELRRYEAATPNTTAAVGTWGRKVNLPSTAQAVKPSRSERRASGVKGNEHADRHGISRRPSKGLRPRDSISAPKKFLPSRAAEAKKPNHARYAIGKRKRDDDEEEDAESLLSTFLSPAAEKILAPLKVKPEELTEHMNNNVVLLFYPKTDGAPRVRLLGGCDNVQKLFAQALAGDVFGDGSGSGTKVLALTFGGGQQKTRSLVEDDDQDYDDLVTVLKGLDCWFMEDGVVQGSLTVEVRAK